MKFNKSYIDEWESDDWRWTICKWDKVFALYDNANENAFVGDFPSMALAIEYAEHVNSHEAATMSANA